MNHRSELKGRVRGRYWHHGSDGRIVCDLCPRGCCLREGQHGLCLVRANHENALYLTTYGRSSGFALDPIEKKPLYHFLPGTSVLSFGTAGCNLTCRFCQNASISKSRDDARLLIGASPCAVAEMARRRGSPGVAFTYNEPSIALEYLVDVAQACHEQGIFTVAVTDGYVSAAPRAEMYRHIDAANVDLKAFTDDFYRRICGAELQPVLETLVYLARETDVWLEVTTLLIPGLNDSESELRRLVDWMMNELGPEVPIHFTAFHPAWKLKDRPPTPPSTLRRARRTARERGLRHVYTGNVADVAGQSTECTECGELLIERQGYRTSLRALEADGRCRSCGTRCAGVFSRR